MHSADTNNLLLLGILLMLCYLAQRMARSLAIPRVTVLLLVGIGLGPEGFNILPSSLNQWLPLVSSLCLATVGFMLGQHLSIAKVKKLGSTVLSVAMGQTLVSVVCVFTLTWLAGAPLPLALLLASIAPATAPAASLDVIKEIHAQGPLTDTVLGVVAIDDALGLFVFSILLVVAHYLAVQETSADHIQWHDFLTPVASGMLEILGAVLIGVVAALVLKKLLGLRPIGQRRALLLMLLGMIFACAGVAQYFGCSYILACVVFGALVASLESHAQLLAKPLDMAMQPLLSLFFLLASLKLQFSLLDGVWFVLLTYIFARVVGKLIGCYLGAGSSARRSFETIGLVGWCLLPQAGVAIGMAFIAVERIPSLEATLLPIIVSSTVFFELVGPVISRRVLAFAGESNADPLGR